MDALDLATLYACAVILLFMLAVYIRSPKRELDRGNKAGAIVSCQLLKDIKYLRKRRD